MSGGPADSARIRKETMPLGKAPCGRLGVEGNGRGARPETKNNETGSSRGADGSFTGTQSRAKTISNKRMVLFFFRIEGLDS